ncbi:hypothetical protein [Faecalibaculum rodentium]|uniref:hypothetical protein n=1 Tax=Faecalibaculum rodentium TaxID=1702221 RepID=UPI001F57CBE0|nr:hypothetical protein [Faecalibaculum rodentium]
MKKFKYLLVMATAFLLTIFSLNPIHATTDEFHEIYAGNVSEGVTVFENSKGEKTAILDQAVLSGTVTLYSVGDEVVTLDIQPESGISPYATGPWSAGTIPSGTSTLTPHYSNGFVSASFNATVQKSPTMIRTVYNPSITGALVTINSSNLSIVRGSAGSSTAIASLTFIGNVTQDGYTAVSGSWYLTLELDSAGHTRISWNY